MGLLHTNWVDVVRTLRSAALCMGVLFLTHPPSAEAAPRYALAYWYEVGGFQNACCGGTCSCSGTGNHSVYVHVLDSDGNKLGNIRVEDADNPGFFGITNNNPADKFGFVEIPIFIGGTPALRVNDSGLASDITPEMIENRAPTNGHYSWECAFMRIPDGVTLTFNTALTGTPNLSGGGCDIHAPFTNSCSYYDTNPLNWASDAYSLDVSASTYGQTFVATGDRVVIAKFQPTVGFLNDLRYGVTIRENGPGGAIVGTQAVSRLMKSDEYFTQIVTWPISGPNAAVVVPGNTYYAEIKRVDQAGSINMWRRNSDLYPLGQMFRGGSVVAGMDLIGRIICADSNIVIPPPGIPGDFDDDDDVDMTDYAHLQACYRGLGVVQDDPACADTLLDNDADVDENDLTVFLGCMSGTNVPADIDCAE